LYCLIIVLRNACLTIVEINPATGTLRQSIAIPTIANGANYPCTLTASAYAKEGFLTLSADRTTLLFGCYAAPPGTNGYSSTAPRVIARVYGSGLVDTSLVVTDVAVYPNVFGSVASQDGATAFWLSAQPFASGQVGAPSPPPVTNGGIRYLYAGGASVPTTTVPIYNTFPIASLTWGIDGSLFAAKTLTALTGDAAAGWGRIGSAGSPPTASGATAVFSSFGAGITGGSCQTIFQVIDFKTFQCYVHKHA
jgi:hypothetical protein